ncbi:hypothetical protein Hanom_Chr09g00862231 [Helianthus anomalus]
MSWFSNYLFGEYSDKSVVLDSYEGGAISDSYEKLVPSNMRGEVVSSIRYRDNTVQLNLNIPVEDSYAQHNYLNYGYAGEPYPQVEYPYGQSNYPGHGYGGEQSYVQQDYPDHGYSDEYNYVRQDYPDYGYGGEQSFVQQDYPDWGVGGEQNFVQQNYSDRGDGGE